MGIAIAGQIPTGIAIAGVEPSGVAIAGQNVWTSVPPSLDWELLSSTYISTALNIPTVSSAIDTTGANLIVVISSTYLASALTDNQNNIWLLGTNTPTLAQLSFSTIWYCKNPITSTSHIFTLSNTASTIFVMAFKVSGSFGVGQSSLITDPTQPPTLTLPPISIAPTSLVVSGIVNIQNVGTIDSGFTKVLNAPFFGTARVGGAATLVSDVSVPSLSPTWNLTASGYAGASAATMFSFVPGSGIPWQLLSFASIIAPAQTSSSINTIGAKLIVATVVYNSTGTSFSFVDSQNNTWILGATSSSSGTSVTTNSYYCINPVTSTAHTFSDLGSGLYGCCFIAAFKGPPNTAFDQAITNNLNNGQNVYNQLPAITPATNSSLLVSGFGFNGSAALIDSGFILLNRQDFAVNVTFGGAMAYLIPPTASAISPTWSRTTTSAMYSAAVMLSFTGA